MKEIYLEISQEYEKDLQMVNKEIILFEGIYKQEILQKKDSNLTKEILKKLYKERDDHTAKAKFYRIFYKKSQRSEGISS